VYGLSCPARMISSIRQFLFSLSKSWTSRLYGFIWATYCCPFMFPLYLRDMVPPPEKKVSVRLSSPPIKLRQVKTRAFLSYAKAILWRITAL
jgi:hypothetical protein